jgi:S1-C subfamily serine protease
VVNAGDLAKEYGIVPLAAAAPSPTSSVLIAPPGDLIQADSAAQSAARAAAATTQSALVRIDVTLPDSAGVASGIVLDQLGHILTNQHVVDGAQTITVTFANNHAVPAQVIGTDQSDDLAVIAVPVGAIGAGVKAATLLGGGKLAAGQLVVGVGFTPYFSTSPAVRLGVFQRKLTDGVGILRSDTFILPGDSGGMLLNLSGNVVGVNDEIRITGQPGQPLIGYSIDAAAASRIAGQLIQAAGPGAE